MNTGSGIKNSAPLTQHELGERIANSVLRRVDNYIIVLNFFWDLFQKSRFKLDQNPSPQPSPARGEGV
jgi:hypothetical protein